MPNFDALPNELRNSIMFVRALGMYKRERRRIGSWGVTYAQGFRWTHGVPVLKDVCRRHGLRVSGTRNALLFRIRDHKAGTLSGRRGQSERFWRDAVLRARSHTPRE